MAQLKRRWLRLQGYGLYLYHQLVPYLLRWHINGKAYLTQALASKRPLLWVFWHGQLSPFIMYGVRFHGAPKFYTVIIGGDDRTEILSSLANYLGATPQPVDMNGNPVAAGRAVLHIVRAMKQGKYSFIAPDGPDGPAEEPKGGVAVLAQKSEGVIVPVGAHSSPGYFMRRWDKYQLPVPLGKIYLSFGKPIFVEKDDKREALLVQITAALSQSREKAQQLAGVSPALLQSK